LPLAPATGFPAFRTWFVQAGDSPPVAVATPILRQNGRPEKDGFFRLHLITSKKEYHDKAKQIQSEFIPDGDRPYD